MEQKLSVAPIALKWGAIMGIVSIVYQVVVNLTEQYTNLWAGGAALLIPILGLILAFKEYRTNNGGFLTLGQALNIGTLAIAVSSLIGGVFQQIYQNFIDPNFTEKMINKMRDYFEDLGLDEAMVEKQMDEITDKFNNPGISFFQQILFSILIGFVLSLIIGAIMRKEKPVFD